MRYAPLLLCSHIDCPWPASGRAIASDRGGVLVVARADHELLVADGAPSHEDVDGDDDTTERVHEPHGSVGGDNGRHESDRIAAHVVDVVLRQRLDGGHVATTARDHNAAVDPHEELDADGEPEDRNRRNVDANLRRIVETCKCATTNKVARRVSAVTNQRADAQP